MRSGETRLWHPFADMGVVRSSEFVVERGHDVWVWDQKGACYLDATASLWYANVGHGRVEIAEAVFAQLTSLEAYSTFGEFGNEPALELAAQLGERAPVENGRVFFTNGGGDAIETAAKLARRYWVEMGAPERTHLISRTAAYHGTHGYGTALGGIEANRAGYGPLAPDTTLVQHDSVEALEAALASLGPKRVAALFVEPVIGAGGVHPPQPGYLEAVAELCRQTGVLLVIDAVICGFGRLGTWFGIERWGLEPDMITFAKGVTSGYLPLGGVVVSDRVAAPFWAAPSGAVFRQGTTYAGHPACCAAALANLTILEREGLVARGEEAEGELLDALAPLAGHELVSEVRGGVGTLAGIELVSELLRHDPAAPERLSRLVREHGVLVRPLGTSIAVSPPLTATAEHFGLIAEAIGAGLDELAEARRPHAGAGLQAGQARESTVASRAGK